MAHVLTRENGDLETHFQHNDEIYVCAYMRRPEKTTFKEENKLTVVVYSSTQSTTFSNADIFIFDKKLLLGGLK